MKKRGKLVLFIFLFCIALATSAYASNPFYFNESEAETSTTSTTFVNKTTLTVTTDAAPYLIIASGEIRGAVANRDVLARLLIDETTDYGNISFQPDTTGDRETFMFMRVVNLTAGSHTAALQYAAESGQTTYLRRARIFATKLDDYYYAENESEITPGTTPTNITVLTFTPPEAGNYLIIGTAEISAGRTTRSIEANLSIDGNVVNAVSNEGETTTDFESFAGQNTTYLTAASHTIKIEARAESGATQRIRRARIVAIRLPENFRDFFNESSAQSSTQSATWVEKVDLTFTPNVTGTYFITGTADIWSSSARNGAYVDVNLTIDGTEYGFTSIGLSDTTDRLTFTTSKLINLTNTSHTIKIYFRQTESVAGTPTVYIRNARINALGPDDRPSVAIPLTFDSSLTQKSNFSLGELTRIWVNVTDAAGASDISQVLINITKPNGTLNVTNALMTSIASITNGFTYEYNFTIPDESTSIGIWNISIVANDTINAKGSNRTNFSAFDTTVPNITATTATPSPVNIGSNITINATVTDNIAVDKVWVTLWNATTAIITKFLSLVSGNLYSTQITTNESFTTNTTYTIYANDTSNNNATPLNGSFLVNRAPRITLNAPANNTQINNTQTVNFNFTAIDDLNITLSCSIYLDAILNQTNASTQNNTATIFTITGISYGNHTWFINCTDGSLSNVSETRAFSIADTLKPNVYDLKPIAGSSYDTGTTIEIAANVTDNVAVSTVIANITYPNSTIEQLQLSLAIGDKYNNSFTIPALAGQYNITVIANDTSNNINDTEKTYFTATTPNQAPQITLNYPLNNTQFNNTQDINFNFTATDDLNTTLSCSIYLDGTLNQTNSSTQNNTITNFQITGISYGSHSWFMNCSDGSLSNVSGTWYFNINDTMPPSITIVSPIATTYNYSYILVNISTADNVAVDRVWFNWNGTNESYITPVYVNFTPDGSYTLYAYANDTSNNLNSTNVTFTVNTTVNDTTPPAVYDLRPIAGSSYNVSDIIEIAANVTDDVSVSAVLANVTLPNGTVQQLILANILDAKYNNSFLIPNLTGLYNVTFIANDSSNNVNNSEKTNFSVFDITPPIISNVNATSITNSSAVIVWTTDELSNSTVNYGLNDSLGSFVYESSMVINHSIPISSLSANTTYFYNVSSCDSSGNCNTSGPYNFTTTTVADTTAPAIENVSATSITNQSATITWDTDELSNSSVNYGTTLALGSYASNSPLVTSHSVPLTALTNFTLYYYNVSSCDSSGNCNTTGPYNFTTLQNNDTQPPSITFIAPTPANGTTTNVSYAFINTTITDNVAVSTALLEWNGTNESMDFGGGDNWYKNKTGISDGTYTYKVWANDTANNWNYSETRTLTVSTVNDTVPPTINYTIYPKVVINSTNVSLTINASDLNLNSTWAVIKLPDSSEETISLANGVTYYYTTSQIGRHNVTFYANDSAGNTANATDYFIVGEQMFFNTTIVDANLNGINSTIKFYYLENEIASNESPVGNFTNIEIASYIYDILISAYSDALKVLFRGVNISENSERTIGLDKTTISGFVITYGINNSYNITNATVTLGYNGTNYTNEALLAVYRCNDWNFTSRTCTGTWNSISAAQNTTGKYFTFNTTNLSGFSVKQETTSAPSRKGGIGAGTVLPISRSALVSVAENKTEQYIIRTCLQKNQKVEFYVQGNKKVSVTEISYVDIRSTLLINNSYVDYYDIKLYDTVMFDTNNNGFYDLKVNLYQLTDSAACYIFYEIRETIPKINITENITEAKEKEKENITEQPMPVETSRDIWILSLILIVVIGIILFLLKKRYKKIVIVMLFIILMSFTLIIATVNNQITITTGMMGVRDDRMSPLWPWLLLFLFIVGYFLYERLGRISIPLENGNVVILKKKNKTFLYLEKRARRTINKLKNVFSSQESSGGVSMEMDRFVPAKKLTPKEFEKKIIERRVWRYHEFVKPKIKVREIKKENIGHKKQSIKKQIISQLKEVYKI